MGGRNKTNKVFGQNIKRRSQKLFEHPITLKAHLHAKYSHLKHLAKRKKLKKQIQMKCPKA
jgi:hypothetical protein